MSKKIFALLLIALITTFTVHAESYTFSDSTHIDVPEYNEYRSGWGWGSNRIRTEGGTPDDVVGSSISVSNTIGKISDLNVTINGLTSEAFYDMTFVLVGPNNTGVVLSSFAGGDAKYTGTKPLDLTFDDEADNKIQTSTNWNNVYQNTTSSTSYQTSAYGLGNWYINGGGQYSVIDPVGEGFFGSTEFSETNLLSAFDDISANGIWTLLAYDNLGEDATSYNGWTLGFTAEGGSASGAVPEPAEWALMAIALIGIIGFKRYNSKKTLSV